MDDDGRAALSRRDPAPGHRRLRRQQRLPHAPLEAASSRRLADETGLEIAVCHFPPGTSKWNKIEHRLFSAITQNWRGKPLVSHEAIVKLIAATTTRTGLRVRSELDTNAYPKGVTVSDAEMETLHIQTRRLPRRVELLAPASATGCPLTEVVIS